MRNAAQLVEQSIDRDFVALLLAQNRAGAAVPVAQVLHANAIPNQLYLDYLQDPSFEVLVQKHTKELVDSGFGIEKKSAVLYEMALPLAYDIARDTDQPGSTRLTAIKFLGEASGKFNPKQAGVQIAATGQSYQIIINYGDDPEDTEAFEGSAVVVPDETPDAIPEVPEAEGAPAQDPVMVREDLVNRFSIPETLPFADEADAVSFSSEYDDEAAAYANCD
jgi:hypothetical protein